MAKAAPSAATLSLGVVLITGAAKRLGQALALGFAHAGYDVALHCHESLDAALALKSTLENLGRKAGVFPQSFSEPFAANDYLTKVEAELGAVVGVVNNASIFRDDHVASTDSEALARHYQVNTIVPIMLAQALYQRINTHPAIADHWVINILDQKLRRLNPDYFSYTLAKSALATATTMMAMQCAPQMRVCGILPGLILPSDKMDTVQFQHAQAQALMSTSGSVAQVVKAALFLAQQTLMTGEMMAVDGGQHLLGLTRDVVYLSASEKAANRD